MKRFAVGVCITGLLVATVACKGKATTEPASAGGADSSEAVATAPVATAPTARAERAAITPSVDAQSIVDATDRPQSDRKVDTRRRSAEMLTFIGVQPGMKVADLMAGGGHTTELLARAVGPQGVVYAQNNAFAMENIVKDGLAERLKREVVANVVPIEAELDAPLPKDATGLDLVTIVFSYHDAVILGTDVAVLNKAVYDALAPGGRFIVVDHAAPAGTPLTETEALHRLDEAIVVEQVTAAGFESGRKSDFLRNPSDDLTAPAFRIGFETDRFALEFIKPAA